MQYPILWLVSIICLDTYFQPIQDTNTDFQNYRYLQAFLDNTYQQKPAEYIPDLIGIPILKWE